MKKIFGFLVVVAAIVCFLFFGIMPSTPSAGECAKFHPHVADFGGDGQVVIQVLNRLIDGTGTFNAWTAAGRTVLQFRFNGQNVFLAYGTGNPTMFIPSSGIDYFREQTSGLKKVTSIDGLNAVRTHLSCLRDAYADQLVPVPASEPVNIPTPDENILKAVVPIGAAFLLLFVLGLVCLTKVRLFA